MRRTSWGVSVVGFFLLAGFAWGQVQPIPKPVEPPSPNPSNPPSTSGGNQRAGLPPTGNPAPGAEAPASELAPFLDAQTIGVARVDLADLDLKATRAWVIQAVDELRKEHKEVNRAQDDVGREFDKLSTAVERFRQAGARQMFWVVSLDELTADHPPFAVVPVEAGTDPKGIEAAFQSLVPPPPANGANADAQDTMGTAVIRSEVVFGVPSTLKRLKGAAAPAPQVELFRVFDAAGKGQIRVALIPQEGPRKAFESISAELPKELGGGPIQGLSRGLQWMELTLSLPPEPSLHIVIDGTDAQAAAKLNDIVNHAIDWARNTKEIPPDATPFVELVGQMKPKLDGNQITVGVSGEDTRKLAGVLASDLLMARTMSTRVAVAANLRQLGMGVMMYANEHKEELPKDLGNEIAGYLGGADAFKRLWVDPLRPNQQKPYVYLKLADKMSDVKEPAQAVMIYENHSTWDNGINVEFADGHVEWVTDEKQFKQMLDQTKKNNPNAVEMPQ